MFKINVSWPYQATLNDLPNCVTCTCSTKVWQQFIKVSKIYTYYPLFMHGWIHEIFINVLAPIHLLVWYDKYSYLWDTDSLSAVFFIQKKWQCFKVVYCILHFLNLKQEFCSWTHSLCVSLIVLSNILYYNLYGSWTLWSAQRSVSSRHNALGCKAIIILCWSHTNK